MMGLITERGSAADGFAAVSVPPAPGEAAGSGAAMLHRRSALPSRRSVLHLHCQPGTFVPEDLVSWYTERGFHFWVADLRPPDGQRSPERAGRRSRAGRFARLDAACGHLREAEGIDMIIVTADAADAATAAEWCGARRDAGCADALILSAPAFGRRLRRGLDIACPVLVLSPAGGEAGRRPALRRGKDRSAIKLGPHVTWLRLNAGLGGQAAGPREEAPAQDADRRQFFDEMGRWLGAYMYGHVRDQLL
jgi:hypothetical protein